MWTSGDRHPDLNTGNASQIRIRRRNERLEAFYLFYSQFCACTVFIHCLDRFPDKITSIKRSKYRKKTITHGLNTGKPWSSWQSKIARGCLGPLSCSKSRDLAGWLLFRGFALLLSPGELKTWKTNEIRKSDFRISFVFQVFNSPGLGGRANPLKNSRSLKSRDLEQL